MPQVSTCLTKLISAQVTLFVLLATVTPTRLISPRTGNPFCLLGYWGAFVIAIGTVYMRLRLRFRRHACVHTTNCPQKAARCFPALTNPNGRVLALQRRHGHWRHGHCPSDTLDDAMSSVINFYSVNDEYGEFSNFALYPITLQGKLWPTSEHYFQAQKFAASKDQGEIRKAKSPMTAARMGRDRKRTLRRDWESVKDGIMRDALIAKFTQHASLGELLIATGDAKLVEHTENDSYWGDGGDGSGGNMLGRLLMQVRSTLSIES